MKYERRQVGKLETSKVFMLTEITPQELQETGLLWLINASVLHPRGFALAVDMETGKFELWGNGDEPWQFDPSSEVEVNRAFAKIEGVLQTIKMNEKVD